MFPPERYTTSIRLVHRAEQCSRSALRETLSNWVKEARPGQPHLFYFHGHGGRAKFADLPQEQAERISYYLQCFADKENGRSGLLDIEISSWMTELYERCGGNVTVVIDSCHSGGMTRDLRISRIAVQRLSSTPTWIAEVFANATKMSLAANSHPGIVRLTGSSPARWSRVVKGMGRFTHHWLASLEQLGTDWRRCSWTLLAHQVRQRVIEAGRRESQWVSLAGPGNRLLFSLTETKPVRAVGLVDHEGKPWLRAGALTGVKQGDLWAPLAPLLSAAKDPQVEHAGMLEVDEVPQDSRAVLRGTVETRSLRPHAAALVRAAIPMPVQAIDSPETCRELEDTVWLTAGNVRSRYVIQGRNGPHGRELQLEDRRGILATLRFRDDLMGRAGLLELLEDRARTERLLEAASEIERGTAERPPIACEIGVDDHLLCLDDDIASLNPGQALWFSVHNTSPLPSANQPWQTYFVTAVMIDTFGRSILLNANQPEGIELGPGERESIGQRLGGATRGLILDWPTLQRGRFADSPREQRLELLCLLSDRPMPLAHLSHAMPISDGEAFHMEGLEQTPAVKNDLTNATEGPPEHKLGLARAWGLHRFKLCLTRTEEFRT